jgi:ankyrin repeat protein
VPLTLSPSEVAELQAAFRDLLNYESEDPFAPINPLTYRAPDGDTCLHVAAHRGNLRAVELLLKAGLNINEQGDMGYTPLQYATTPEVVQLLLSRGASSTIVNEFGQSPIGWKNES